MRRSILFTCVSLFVCLICYAASASALDAAGADVLWGVPAQETVRSRPAKLIPVPLVRQARDNTCGVACVQSVLRYAGYEFDIREDLLLEPLAVANDGTPFRKMADFLNQVRRGDEHGDKNGDAPVFRASLRENMTLPDLVLAIDAGHPVICLIQAWRANDAGEYELAHDYKNKWDSGHYVVAVGHDAERVYFMDPSTIGNYTYIPKSELDARWHGLGEVTEEGIEYFEHAGIVVAVDKPTHSPGAFHKIL